MMLTGDDLWKVRCHCVAATPAAPLRISENPPPAVVAESSAQGLSGIVTSAPGRPQLTTKTGQARHQLMI
jgi:hypothetical protein